MYCPQCSTSQSDDLKFCKSCGANLQAVRQALTTPDTDAKTNEKFDWSKTWVADILLSPEEQKRRKREQQTSLDAEESRYKEIKAGVITSSVGLSVMIFLFVFMQGLVQGGAVQPPEAEILKRLWIAGVIPFFIGLGLIFNGVIVSKKLVELAKREIEQRERVRTMELAARSKENSGLPAADWSAVEGSIPSVTEHTTRELRESRTKQ
jgi:hypothetical protein